MRLDRQNFDVDRQHVRVRHDIRGIARRDVDRFAAETETDRRSGRRVIGKVERGAHAQRLGLPRRLHVQLDDEVAARVETPRRPGRRRPRRLTRRPSEELPFRVSRIRHHAADVARLGIALVQTPRRFRAIDADARVVDNARVVGTEFHRAHVPRTVERNRQHERAERVAAAGGDRI